MMQGSYRIFVHERLMPANNLLGQSGVSELAATPFASSRGKAESHFEVKAGPSGCGCLASPNFKKLLIKVMHMAIRVIEPL